MPMYEESPRKCGKLRKQSKSTSPSDCKCYPIPSPSPVVIHFAPNRTKPGIVLRIDVYLKTVLMKRLTWHSYRKEMIR